MNATNRDTVTKAVKLIAAVSETIRELGEVPSGVLYSQLCGMMTFSMYEDVIAILKSSRLVAERNYVLYWTGPLKGVRA